MWKKRIFAVLLCALLILPITVYAAENPQIVYDDAQKKFSLENTDGSNLFVNFNPVMPGDELSVTVKVGVRNIDDKSVNMYLGSLDEDVPDAMKNVMLKVEVAGTTVSENPLGKALANGARIKIGTFTQDELKDVKITLKIPTSIGNELADARQMVHWEWIAEVSDGTDASTGSPSTGDANLLPWFLLMVVSAGALISLLRKRDRIIGNK